MLRDFLSNLWKISIIIIIICLCKWLGKINWWNIWDSVFFVTVIYQKIFNTISVQIFLYFLLPSFLVVGFFLGICPFCFIKCIHFKLLFSLGACKICINIPIFISDNNNYSFSLPLSLTLSLPSLCRGSS